MDNLKKKVAIEYRNVNKNPTIFTHDVKTHFLVVTIFVESILNSYLPFPYITLINNNC